MDKKIERNEYPEGDLAPEMGKRDTGANNPLHPDVVAAYDYVESVKETSDFRDEYAWHGWALREAFLAGVTFAKGGGMGRPM